jgi:hypothetical protein
VEEAVEEAVKEVVAEVKGKKRRRREEDILFEGVVEADGPRARKRPMRYN